MTDNELKRLSRSELLQILLDQSIEIDHLRRKLADTQAALDERELKINEVGTLAEASLRLNQIFSDADAAAALYLENIRRMEAEWVEKTGGKSVDDTAAKPESDGESEPDAETAPAEASTDDTANESSVSDSEPQKEPQKKSKKSRHKK